MPMGPLQGRSHCTNLRSKLVAESKWAKVISWRCLYSHQLAHRWLDGCNRTFFVDVIRSLQLPHFSCQSRLVNQRLMASVPRADTSDPAWVKRKILSINKRTSWPSTSRKYSDSNGQNHHVTHPCSRWSHSFAQRPYCFFNNARFFISVKVTLSRVRSPTPVNTEIPPCSGNIMD